MIRDAFLLQEGAGAGIKVFSLKADAPHPLFLLFGEELPVGGSRLPSYCQTRGQSIILSTGI
jgi:hypothetical protein